jgi:cation diffusion facilitator family transporter
MTSIADFSEDRSLSDPERYRVAQHATWVSAGVNLLLTLVQIAVGWVAHSQSLIAHGLHSFSDLLSDFLVLFANRQGSHPADENHPYGHARVETVGTLVLGVSLIAVGAGILLDAAVRLREAAVVAPVEWLALWAAIGTVFAKEGLYRYLIRVADRLRSRLLAANAMHTRADAASALVVVAGVGGALAGWPFLDLVAALLMGAMIFKLGAGLAWEAIRELIDEGLADEELTAIRAALEATPGVIGVHDLRTRRMAHRVLVDVHVMVEPRISVSEGHYIAETARIAALRSNPQILDVLVHIDPEDDRDYVGVDCTVPVRSVLLANIDRMLGDQPKPARVVLHYLGGRVEAELDYEDAPQQISLVDLQARLDAARQAYPVFDSVRARLIMHH